MHSAPHQVRRIDDLDLEPIAFKLTHPDPDEDALTLDQADDGIALYRMFLKLRVLHPRTSIVPTKAIDRVWHAHMLDTAKYRADCQLVFGRFLDHFPYAGLRGEADRVAWLADFRQTQWLFSEAFGVDIGSAPAASACRNHGDGSDCCVGCVTPLAVTLRPRPQRPARVMRGSPPGTARVG